MNQATAPHLLEENQFKLLVNMDQTEIGGVGHRLGTSLYLDLISGTGSVKGLHMYEKADGNRYLHMVEGGNLRVANESGGTWTSQDSSQWATSSDVDMVNFIDRHYMIGSGATEYLVYATNTGVCTAVSGDIAGEYLATNGAYLMVIDSANQKAQWSGVATDTFAAADYAQINGYATGVGSFGIGRPFVVFTDSNYLIVDPANVYTSEVRGFGCADHRSIQTVRGHLIYLGREGLYQLAYNESFPIEISRLVRNDWSKDAIFNQIAGTAWTSVASAVIDNRYFCALSNLDSTVKGYTLNDCMLEYDIAAQSLKVHTFTDGGLASVMAQFIDTNGDLDLYAGSNDDKAVYKLFPAATYTDDTSGDVATAVTARLITKDHAFFDTTKQVTVMMNVIALHVKYYASSALTLKYSLDGNETYSTFPETLPATTAGYSWGYEELPLGSECKTISLDISGTGKFMIYGIGYEVDALESTGIDVL